MPKKQPAPISLVPVTRELTDDDLTVIVETARKRAELVGEMRAALVARPSGRPPAFRHHAD